ncbi:NUDIX domain-containing protein [Amnibacterium sp.]|uniref:NUDIX hydrolase n=1 Tax=Amnibacterium sp. TaxID=1872496 RepID=UPI00263491B5|nr:NUDIX domain-containing protein [Amnibacterium sp.]MCU1473482.1 mutator mutT protein [Amnibacterium sp.]
MTEARVVRSAARVLLVDDADRVLLIEGFDPAAAELGTWWITPGGGREADEDAERAAVREVWEETGLVLEAAALAGPLWRRTTVFPFDGAIIEQTEDFFAARVAHFDPAGTALTDLEHRSTVRMRWWTLAKIEASDATIYPERLAELLRTALTLV